MHKKENETALDSTAASVKNIIEVEMCLIYVISVTI